MTKAAAATRKPAGLIIVLPFLRQLRAKWVKSNEIMHFCWIDVRQPELELTLKIHNNAVAAPAKMH
eukprot:scaffold177340_cov24-Prasinocladus_malaysianus.AAC.1